MPLGAGLPSIYGYGARCTPSLGGRGVVVNFNLTLSQPITSTETLQLAEDAYIDSQLREKDGGRSPLNLRLWCPLHPKSWGAKCGG